MRLFKKKPELKIAVFWSTERRGVRRAKELTVEKISRDRNVYVIYLDDYQAIRVEVEKQL